MNATGIKTTGDLRKFLAEGLVDLREGKLRVEVASQITKMAAQINESFYSEVKIARTQKELGVVSAELGGLPVGKGNAK